MYSSALLTQLAAAGAAPAQAKQANPLAQIPQNIIPNGNSSYTAYVGPCWALSRNQGAATVSRTPNQITINTPAGRATIRPDPNNANRVIATLPDGSTYSGTLRPTKNGVIFDTGSGQTVTFTRNGNRVDISLSGFGALVDRMGVYLVRRP
jgi:hypothetical protein